MKALPAYPRLGVVFALLLAACTTAPTQPTGSPGETGAAPAPDPTGEVETRTSEPVAEGDVVTLTAWTIGPDAPSFYRRDNLIDAAEALNAELEAEGASERVVVEATFESGGQWADFKQKFTLAAEAGTAPDIILAGHEDMAPWASAGYVIELDSYLDQYPVEDVIERLWGAMQLAGTTYAVPQDTEARPMFYRKDLLSELGWSDEEIESLPERVRDGEWTMDDLVATAQDAVEAGVVDEGKGWWHRPTRGHDHYMFYFQNGGRMQDAESGNLVITRDALVEHFALHANAVNEWGITPENFIGSDFRAWHETVTAGEVLFYNGGVWHWAEWQSTYEVPREDLEQNVGYMLVPAAEPGGEPVTLSHPLVYMVTSNAENPELAYRLIQHATTPELNSRHAVESAHLAILTTQNDDPTYQENDFLAATSYMSDYAQFIPNHPQYGAYDEVIFRFLSAVAAGEFSPEEAADAAIQELQSQLGDDLIVE